MAMSLLYLETGQAFAVNPTSFKKSKVLRRETTEPASTSSSWPKSNALAQNYFPPTIEYSVNGAKLLLPDWMQINFSNLPPISSSGEINFPGNLVRELGYDPSRIWQAGQTADTYMMLGDFTDSFQLQEFALRNIADITQLDLSSLSLADYELVSWQTAETLTQAIPGLEKLPIGKVKPLAELFRQEGISFGRHTKIGELLERYDSLKDLSLGKLGKSLADYGLNSIPGLQETPLKKFQQWQRSYINQIPGLNQVPFRLFPLFFGDVGFSILGQADVVFSSAEHGAPNAAGYFVSGSATEGSARKPKIKPVDCETGEPCSYLELTDLVGRGGNLHGKRWGSGETQTVKGGFGPLKWFLGNEPTGLLPYGPGFKVAITGADESPGQANFGLYFRACVQPLFAPYTCTAYGIGPLPWLPVREKEALVIFSPVQSFRVNPPISYQQKIDAIIASAGGDNNCTEGCVEGDGIATGSLSNPAPGYPITSGFGLRIAPCQGCSSYHPAVDLATPPNTPIQSADGGVVIGTEWWDGYGKTVVIDHGNGVKTRYSHLNQINVKPGQKVSKGQAIALSGATGNGTGPHLDFGVYKYEGSDWRTPKSAAIAPEKVIDFSK